MPSVLGLTGEDARAELAVYGIPMQFIEEARVRPGRCRPASGPGLEAIAERRLSAQMLR